MGRKQIGEIIRTLRKNKGITQEQLAEILEISTPAVSKWEGGQTNPDISTLPIIARYFNVTIDFLLDFTIEISIEDIKVICDNVIQKFSNQNFKDAQREWSDYLRRFPIHYPLRYELAMIGVFNLEKAQSLEEMYLFANRLISVFEQCTNSDELKIKQGAYFQMANLYIVLQDYDKAQIILNEIPEQLVNPDFLLSMIYVNKGDFEQANRNIQKNIYRSLSDIIGELGNLISAYRLIENENTDIILDLFYKQKQIISIFGLEPTNGIGVGLQIAELLAQNKEYERVKSELEQVIDILEKYPNGVASIKDITFFKDIDLKTFQDSNSLFMVNAYRILVEQIFTLLENNYTFQEIKSRLEQALS